MNFYNPVDEIREGKIADLRAQIATEKDWLLNTSNPMKAKRRRRSIKDLERQLLEEIEKRKGEQL